MLIFSPILASPMIETARLRRKVLRGGWTLDAMVKILSWGFHPGFGV
jgi:hypothetical protein